MGVYLGVAAGITGHFVGDRANSPTLAGLVKENLDTVMAAKGWLINELYEHPPRPGRRLLRGMIRPNVRESSRKSKTMESHNQQSGIVGGYDGQRSPLQPPLRETSYYGNGRIRFDDVKNPDGSANYKTHRPDGSLEFEDIKDSAGGMTYRYYCDDQLISERVDNPDGSGSSRGWYPNNQLEYERIDNSDGSWSEEMHHPNGQLKSKTTSDPAGKRSQQCYDEDGRPLENDPAAV